MITYTNCTPLGPITITYYYYYYYCYCYCCCYYYYYYFYLAQLSTVFLIQDGGLNMRWKYISTRPAKIRLHCRLSTNSTSMIMRSSILFSCQIETIVYAPINVKTVVGGGGGGEGGA